MFSSSPCLLPYLLFLYPFCSLISSSFSFYPRHLFFTLPTLFSNSFPHILPFASLYSNVCPPIPPPVPFFPNLFFPFSPSVVNIILHSFFTPFPLFSSLSSPPIFPEGLIFYSLCIFDLSYITPTILSLFHT